VATLQVALSKKMAPAKVAQPERALPQQKDQSREEQEAQPQQEEQSKEKQEAQPQQKEQSKEKQEAHPQQKEQSREKKEQSREEQEAVQWRLRVVVFLMVEFAYVTIKKVPDKRSRGQVILRAVPHMASFHPTMQEFDKFMVMLRWRT
jgi:cation transport ATPase